MSGDPKIPALTIGKLAGLAGISDDEVFEAGLKFAIRGAHSSFLRLSQPVYRGLLIKRLDEMRQAALQLRNILSPEERIGRYACNILHGEFARIAGKFGGRKTGHLPELFKLLLTDLSTIAEAAEQAKDHPAIMEKKVRGRPPGKGGSGSALDYFIKWLEFAALRAGGNFKINKNDERGTLLDALELLRAFLPDHFLPKKDAHPYSSYQTVLTASRRDWPKKSRVYDLLLRMDGSKDKK